MLYRILWTYRRERANQVFLKDVKPCESMCLHCTNTSLCWAHFRKRGIVIWIIWAYKLLCLRNTAGLEVSLAFLKPGGELAENSDSVVITGLKKRREAKREIYQFV